MSISKSAMFAAMAMIGAGSVAPLASHAQQAAPAASSAVALPSFEQLDKSNHGYITRSEIPKDVTALKPLRMHFAESDTNGNGRLEKDEYQAFVARAQPGHTAKDG